MMSGKDESNVCIPEHCFYAFDTLYCALVPNTSRLAPEFPNDDYPLFVTWNIHKPGRGIRLRGCIGNFSAMPLHEGLADYALVSAFQDTRFSKISRSELESLECDISLLTDFEDASSYMDWTIGVHGIRISFAHKRQSYSATYLPDVIPAQGWSKLEAVDSAIEKSGYTGAITEDLRKSIRLRRYQSKKCSATWEEYLAWRQSKQ